MVFNNITGGIGAYGSLASLRQQAKEIRKQMESESAAREIEQEAIGLIRNPDTGEMVELSSVPEALRKEWNEREQMDSLTFGEKFTLSQVGDPNAEEVERNRLLGAKLEKIQNKMLAGKKLTSAEKKFLREHYPDMAVKAARMEQEAERLEARLKVCKSPEEACRVYLQAKKDVMSGANKNDGSFRFYIAALDATYAQHQKQNASPSNKVDIRA